MNQHNNTGNTKQSHTREPALIVTTLSCLRREGRASANWRPDRSAGAGQSGAPPACRTLLHVAMHRLYRGAADRPSVHVQRPARGAACVNSAAPRPPDGQPLRGRCRYLLDFR
ncbi:hypothetical protein MSG28_003490 [Choristoneura fumiferana]|uniref:Uncharacterized protein n=1 Tax=Choristoneura fumiferana TaxID=7141 RepID=A0ACC0KF22_CHOFU|nr:hypothetical protein MSG28_003490 [Choristoneura fumiferana]